MVYFLLEIENETHRITFNFLLARRKRRDKFPLRFLTVVSFVDELIDVFLLQSHKRARRANMLVLLSSLGSGCEQAKTGITPS